VAGSIPGDISLVVVITDGVVVVDVDPGVGIAGVLLVAGVFPDSERLGAGTRALKYPGNEPGSLM
jgi:hypothetical protein